MALHPGSAFCTEMLTRALEDCCIYADAVVNDGADNNNNEQRDDSEAMQDDSDDVLNDSSIALSS